MLKYKNPEFTKAVCNVFEEDSEQHSRNPCYVRELIDQMFHNVPKIELFAREQTNGVDCWGNKVRKFEDYEESGEFDQEYNRQNTGTRQIQLSEQISLQKRSSKEQMINSDEEIEKSREG